MILKSYLIEQNVEILKKYQSTLFYGENDGIKDDIKKTIKEKNKNSEIIIFFEEDVLKSNPNLKHIRETLPALQHINMWQIQYNKESFDHAEYREKTDVESHMMKKTTGYSMPELLHQRKYEKLYQLREGLDPSASTNTSLNNNSVGIEELGGTVINSILVKSDTYKGHIESSKKNNIYNDLERFFCKVFRWRNKIPSGVIY